ncbi:hypothetical protein C8Q79DRAFT_995526 [Trametes meyenii]|nr:hypothetical protein C8Q79DRAFT_995526 [Trametes meyenii]
MHNGVQTPMQPLAGPSRQQAQLIVSGIPFSHHIPRGNDQAPQNAPGRHAGDGRNIQNGIHMLPQNGFESSRTLINPSASGRMMPSVTPAQAGFRPGPSTHLSGHPNLPSRQHVVAPSAQSYQDMRLVNSRGGPPASGAGMTTPHLQNTIVMHNARPNMHLQHQPVAPNANAGHHPVQMPSGSRTEPRPPQPLFQEPGVQPQGHRPPALALPQGNHQNHLPPPQSVPTRSQPAGSPRTAPPAMATSGMMIPEGSNFQARQMLEPLRQSMIDGLAQAHQRLTNEFIRLHSAIAKSESTLTKTEALCVKLQQEYAKERALRENAERQCGQLRSEKEAVELEMQKLSEHLPKLFMEYCEARGERDRLNEELTGLRDANSQLREKVTVERETEGQATAPNLPQAVKKEGNAAHPQSTTVVDHDVAVAQALAEAHEERKRRVRLERELETIRTVLQTRALQGITVPPSTTKYTPPSTTEYTPPTPGPEPELPLPAVPSASDDAHETADVAPPTASLPTPKAEQHGDTLLWYSALESESDAIDLTDAVNTSPMKFTPDLPSLVQGAEGEGGPERKRSLDLSTSGEGLPRSAKRRRTLDVPAPWLDVDEDDVASTPVALTTEEEGDPTAHITGDIVMTDEPQQIEPDAAPSSSDTPATPELEHPPSPVSPQHEPPPDVMTSLSLPSSNAIVQLPGHPPPTPTSPTAPEPPKRLSMRHIPLIYITQGDKMHCRICKRRTEDPRCRHLNPRPFVLDEKTAKWTDMAGHCEVEHPESFKALVNMSQSDIEKHLRHLNSGVPSARR